MSNSLTGKYDIAILRLDTPTRLRLKLDVQVFFSWNGTNPDKLRKHPNGMFPYCSVIISLECE